MTRETFNHMTRKWNDRDFEMLVRIITNLAGPSVSEPQAMKQMTRQEAEAALDSHRLYAVMQNGRHWIARRNGATKVWKTRPNEYRIPVKTGLSCYGYVTQLSVLNEHYVIKES